LFFLVKTHLAHVVTRVPYRYFLHEEQGDPRTFRYQARSWDAPRRVIAKVEWHFGELFPRVGFIVTNIRRSSRSVVNFYNKRGTAEQWIKGFCCNYEFAGTSWAMARS
jgi:hypothetical protein